MPCDSCGARQTDPVRGASPWKRGVRDGAQVLICPDCQLDPDWARNLDRCPTCGSTALVRTLGETHCRGCGWIAAGLAPPVDLPSAHTVPGLAEEVHAALDRLRGTPEGPRTSAEASTGEDHRRPNAR